MPPCWFPHKSEPQLIPSAPLSEMRVLTKLVVLSMWRNFERDEAADALIDLGAMLGTIRHMETHPGSTTHLLALADRKATYQA